MSINRRCNWLVNSLKDIRILTYLNYVLNILLGDFLQLYLLSLLYIVALNKGLKDGEAMFWVHVIIILTLKYASDLNLITRSCSVYIISKQYNFFGSWHSSWRNTWWSFLNNNSLINSIDSFLIWYFIRSFGLTICTMTKLNILLIILINWSFFITTFCTYIEQFLKLLIHWIFLGYYSFGFYQVVNMEGSKCSNWLF